MSCHKVRCLLAFRREWTVAEAQRVKGHLAGCPACQAVAREYELIDRRLDRLPAMQAPATLPAAIRVEAGSGRLPPADQAQAAPRPAGQGLLLLVALALLIVAAAVWSTRAPAGPNEATPISAAMPEGPGVTQPTPEANTPREGDGLVFTYTVQPGDNAWSIAKEYGLAPETVMWANPSLERSPDLLAVGDVLTIPAADGVLYRVQPGDTLVALADRYGTTAAEIVSFGPNGLMEDSALVPGQLVLLAGGRKDITTDTYYPLEQVSQPPEGAPQGSGRFAWPTEGVLTQRYWSGHLAIDIANRTGMPIRAADAGYVALAGRDNWGFGNQVVIDHGNGYLTRYAQLDTIRVRAGDAVDKNQQIGTMGSSGRATGPHLHFEIIYNETRRNPLALLPGGGDEVVLGAGSPVAEDEGAELAVYGLQAHLLDQDTGPAFEALDELGFGWIKQQVQWADFEAEKGAYDWVALDALVEAADGAGAAMLWSVVSAPDWSRAGQDLTVDGPPNDPVDLADFVGAMAGRYCGRSLKAVEIWDEQNLHYKWGNMAIDPAAYVQLLKAAYGAVKAACPEMVVVSGGLTPTNAPAPKAMEDTRYLKGMYAHGLADYCDAIGVHLPGYNLPPDADWLTYEDPTAGFDGPFHDRHPSWSFRGTADTYRQVMEAQGDAARPVWVTQFGWAVSDDPPTYYEFAGDNTPEEQATYTLRAFELGHAWDWVEAMFLWNLNFEVVAPGSEKGLWSIVTADWQRTETFWALVDMEK